MDDDRAKAANLTEDTQYLGSDLFNSLTPVGQSRKRYGVRSHVSKNIKDLIELLLNSKVDGEFLCTICEAKYDNDRSFRIHVDRHLVRYICICSMHNSSRDGITLHMRKDCVHKGNLSFFYLVCYQNFEKWKSETGLYSVEWIKDTEYDLSPLDKPINLKMVQAYLENRQVCTVKVPGETQQSSSGSLWASGVSDKSPNHVPPPTKRHRKYHISCGSGTSQNTPDLSPASVKSSACHIGNEQLRDTMGSLPVDLWRHNHPKAMSSAAASVHSPSLVQLSPSPPSSEHNSLSREAVQLPKPTTSVQPLHQTNIYSSAETSSLFESSNNHSAVLPPRPNRSRRDYATEIAMYESQRAKLMSLVEGLNETIDRLRLEWSRQEIADTENMINEAQERLNS